MLKFQPDQVKPKESDHFNSHFLNKLTLVLLFFFLLHVLREEDKNIFDYCRDNNIEYITNAITSQNVDVNIRDEEVPAKLSHSLT